MIFSPREPDKSSVSFLDNKGLPEAALREVPIGSDSRFAVQPCIVNLGSPGGRQRRRFCFSRVSRRKGDPAYAADLWLP